MRIARRIFRCPRDHGTGVSLTLTIIARGNVIAGHLHVSVVRRCSRREIPPGPARSLSLRMRDGVRIAVDVVLLEDLPEGRRIPAILIMTRYWRAEEVESQWAMATGEVEGRRRDILGQPWFRRRHRGHAGNGRILRRVAASSFARRDPGFQRDH